MGLIELSPLFLGATQVGPKDSGGLRLDYARVRSQVDIRNSILEY